MRERDLQGHFSHEDAEGEDGSEESKGKDADSSEPDEEPSASEDDPKEDAPDEDVLLERAIEVLKSWTYFEQLSERRADAVASVKGSDGDEPLVHLDEKVGEPSPGSGGAGKGEEPSD